MFRIFGIAGIIAGTAVSFLLAIQTGLSLAVMACLAGAAVGILLVSTLLVKIFTGVERIINYHQQLSVFAVAAGVLWLLQLPILPYVDILASGIGLLIFFGRLGCLSAGCCYGHPHRWGVSYGPPHVEDGFPTALAGVRLFPVQALESIWVLGIALVSTGLILNSAPAGSALAWHIVAYGIGRFHFEFLRGDPERPYWKGFSEAQWTAWITVSAVAAVESFHWLPLQPWHGFAAAGLALIMILTAIDRRLHPEDMGLFRPSHVCEIAEALRRLDIAGRGPKTSADLIPLARTSLGVQISSGDEPRAKSKPRHYTLSRSGSQLTFDAARKLADLIVKLRHPDRNYQLLQGQQAGIFHLIIEMD